MSNMNCFTTSISLSLTVKLTLHADSKPRLLWFDWLSQSFWHWWAVRLLRQISLNVTFNDLCHPITNRALLNKVQQNSARLHNIGGPVWPFLMIVGNFPLSVYDGYGPDRDRLPQTAANAAGNPSNSALQFYSYRLQTVQPLVCITFVLYSLQLQNPISHISINVILCMTCGNLSDANSQCKFGKLINLLVSNQNHIFLQNTSVQVLHSSCGMLKMGI